MPLVSSMAMTYGQGQHEKGPSMRLESLIGGHIERIDEATPLREAAEWMVSRGIGSLLVTAHGRTTGIFTEHDMVRAAAKGADIDEAIVRNWMSDYPDVASPDWELGQAADVMLSRGFRHLPVVDSDGTPLGMVSIKDLVWALRGTSSAV